MHESRELKALALLHIRVALSVDALGETDEVEKEQKRLFAEYLAAVDCSEEKRDCICQHARDVIPARDAHGVELGVGKIRKHLRRAHKNGVEDETDA